MFYLTWWISRLKILVTTVTYQNTDWLCENIRIIKCIMCICWQSLHNYLKGISAPFCVSTGIPPNRRWRQHVFPEYRRLYETRRCQNREGYQAKHILHKIIKLLKRILCTKLISSWNRQYVSSETYSFKQRFRRLKLINLCTYFLYETKHKSLWCHCSIRVLIK